MVRHVVRTVGNSLILFYFEELGVTRTCSRMGSRTNVWRGEKKTKEDLGRRRDSAHLYRMSME